MRKIYQKHQYAAKSDILVVEGTKDIYKANKINWQGLTWQDRRTKIHKLTNAQMVPY